MSNWYCCCDGADCLIAADEFAADTITSGGWVETAGNWTISGGVLSTQDANGRLEFQTDHPDNVASHIVMVNVKADTSGDKARIWLAGDLYAEIEFSSGGCSTLRLFDDASELLSTEMETVTTNVWYSLCAAYHYGDAAHGDIFVAHVTSLATGGVVHGTLTHFSTAATGVRVGLATGDTAAGTLSFDAFQWYRHKSADVPQCGTAFRCGYYGLAPNYALCAWTQTSGTWTTTAYGYRGLFTYSSNALAKCDVEHPEASWNQAAAATLVGWDGDTVRLYLGYTDASNYVMLEVKFSTTAVSWPDWQLVVLPTGHLKLYDGASLIQEHTGLKIMRSAWNLPSLNVVLCISESGGTYTAKAVVSHYTQSTYMQSKLLTGTVASTIGSQAAIGTGTLGGSMYPAGLRCLSLVPVEKGTDVPCFPCLPTAQTPCPDGSAPETFTVTLAGITDRGCGGCAAYNASHVVTPMPIPCDTLGTGGISVAMQPVYNIQVTGTCTAPSGGSHGFIQLTLTQLFPAGYTARVVVLGYNLYLDFRKDLTADCDTLSAESLTLLTYSSGFPGCGPADMAGVTCTITAN